MVRVRITAVLCCWLLAAPFSATAQTNNGTTGASPNNTAEALSINVPEPSLQDVVFSPSQFQGEAQRQATKALSDVPALWVQTLALPPYPTQASAQAQTKPSSGAPSSSTPSLEGLGFPPNAIQGNAREQELLDKRSHMLQIHQKLGLLTAIPMIAAVFTGPGAKGHHGLPGSPTGRDVHAGLGILTTGMYFTSAYYAIRAPKIPGTKSYGLIRLHKALAWIHGPGMILTPILGSIAFSQLSRGERVHGIAKYHSVVAYTTIIAYGAAILSVTFK